MKIREMQEAGEKQKNWESLDKLDILLRVILISLT